MELFYTDKSLENDFSFQEFIKNSPGTGYLKIRATSANEAVPVEGLNIKVSKEIGNNKIIFYEGKTDYSGMINNISLPAPMAITDDLVEPNFTEYLIEATNKDIKQEYTISICCGFTVIQYINVTPTVNEIRNYYGS